MEGILLKALIDLTWEKVFWSQYPVQFITASILTSSSGFVESLPERKKSILVNKSNGNWTFY